MSKLRHVNNKYVLQAHVLLAQSVQVVVSVVVYKNVHLIKVRQVVCDVD